MVTDPPPPPCEKTSFRDLCYSLPFQNLSPRAMCSLFAETSTKGVTFSLASTNLDNYRLSKHHAHHYRHRLASSGSSKHHILHVDHIYRGSGPTPDEVTRGEEEKLAARLARGTSRRRRANLASTKRRWPARLTPGQLGASVSSRSAGVSSSADPVRWGDGVAAREGWKRGPVKW